MFAQKLIDDCRSLPRVDSYDDRNRLLAGYFEGCGENIPVFEKQIRTHGFIDRLLLVGTTGMGKSSLINLLAGQQIAEVSDGVTGCTFSFVVHKIQHNGYPLEIIDTVGLNHCTDCNSQTQRVETLKSLIRFVKRNSRGFTCVIFVMAKGRISEEFEQSYTIIYKHLLKSIPSPILFVTGCEADDPMDQWGSRNAQHIHEHYKFDHIICGTTLEHTTVISNLGEKRLQTERTLWETIGKYLQHSIPQPIPADVTLVSSVWNHMQTVQERPEATVTKNEQDLILHEISS